MKKFLVLCMCLGAIACTKSTTSTTSTTSPILQTVTTAICDVANTVATDAGQAIVTACAGTGTAQACGTALVPAIMNGGMCANAQVAQMTTAMIVQNKAQGVRPLGVVGNIACPIAIPSIMGFLTSEIPAACGCTQSIGASGFNAALISGCEEAVPFVKKAK